MSHLHLALKEEGDGRSDHLNGVNRNLYSRILYNQTRTRLSGQKEVSNSSRKLARALYQFCKTSILFYGHIDKFCMSIMASHKS